MKKMKARVISTALAVAMGTTAFAGCGDSKEAKGTAKEKKKMQKLCWNSITDITMRKVSGRRQK